MWKNRNNDHLPHYAFLLAGGEVGEIWLLFTHSSFLIFWLCHVACGILVPWEVVLGDVSPEQGQSTAGVLGTNAAVSEQRPELERMRGR